MRLDGPERYTYDVRQAGAQDGVPDCAPLDRHVIIGYERMKIISAVGSGVAGCNKGT